MKKKGIFIILGLFIILNVGFVLAADPFTPMFTALNGFNLMELYNKYEMIIESLFYTIIFVGLAVKASETTQWNKSRAGKTVFVTLGVALAISTMFGMRAIGFTLRSLGKYVAIVLAIMGAYFLYKLVQSFSEDKNGNASAFGISLGVLVLWNLINLVMPNVLSDFFKQNEYIAWVPDFILGIATIVLICSVIAWAIRRFKGDGSSSSGSGSGGGFLNGVTNAINGMGGVRDAWRNFRGNKNANNNPSGNPTQQPFQNPSNKASLLSQIQAIEDESRRIIGLPLNLNQAQHENVLVALEHIGGLLHTVLNNSELSRLDYSETVVFVRALNAYYNALNKFNQTGVTP